MLTDGVLRRVNNTMARREVEVLEISQLVLYNMSYYKPLNDRKPCLQPERDFYYSTISEQQCHTSSSDNQQAYLKLAFYRVVLQ